MSANPSRYFGIVFHLKSTSVGPPPPFFWRAGGFFGLILTNNTAIRYRGTPCIKIRLAEVRDVADYDKVVVVDRHALGRIEKLCGYTWQKQNEKKRSSR